MIMQHLPRSGINCGKDASISCFFQIVAGGPEIFQVHLLSTIVLLHIRLGMSWIYSQASLMPVLENDVIETRRHG